MLERKKVRIYFETVLFISPSRDEDYGFLFEELILFYNNFQNTNTNISLLGLNFY